MSEPNLPDPVDAPSTTDTPRTTAAPPPSTASTGATASTATGASPGKTPRRITPKDVIAIVVGVLVVIFIAENTHKQTIHFVGPGVRTYLWLALLIAVALGFVLGFALAWQRGRRVEKARRG